MDPRLRGDDKFLFNLFIYKLVLSVGTLTKIIKAPSPANTGEGSSKRIQRGGDLQRGLTKKSPSAMGNKLTSTRVSA
jgi:hypothetical protein